MNVYVVYAVMCEKTSKASECYLNYIDSDVLEVFRTEEEAIKYLCSIDGVIPVNDFGSIFFIRDLETAKNVRTVYHICEKELKGE